MIHRFAGRLVADILREKKGSIRHAPLPGGSPPWDEFETMIWEEIEEGARAHRIGFRTVRKLLPDQRPMITQPATLLSFLAELKEAHIPYHLGHYRDEAITVEIAVPGERWEVEFLEDGTVEVEVFRSDGTIHDAGLLAELLEKHAS